MKATSEVLRDPKRPSKLKVVTTIQPASANEAVALEKKARNHRRAFSASCFYRDGQLVVEINI